MLAQAAADATSMIGLPECRVPLAQAAIYLACAPKSRSVATAIADACEDVRSGAVLRVPVHLRSSGAVRPVKGSLGEAGPAANDGGIEALHATGFGVNKVYFIPSDSGAEAKVRINLGRNAKR
jgi:putative ATPase